MKLPPPNPNYNEHVKDYYFFYTWICDKMKRPLAQITYYTGYRRECDPNWCPYKEMEEAEAQDEQARW